MKKRPLGLPGSLQWPSGPSPPHSGGTVQDFRLLPSSPACAPAPAPRVFGCAVALGFQRPRPNLPVAAGPLYRYTAGLWRRSEKSFREGNRVSLFSCKVFGCRKKCRSHRLRNTDEPVTVQKKRMAKASPKFTVNRRRSTPNIGRQKYGIRVSFHLNISSCPLQLVCHYKLIFADNLPQSRAPVNPPLGPQIRLFAEIVA